jgi:glycosyltransferase involved in cell wall biosynthesis
MRVHLRLQYTGYPHWGRHSGFNQLVKFIDSSRFQIQVHVASDSDRDLPIPHAMLRRWLRKRVQSRGMPWYKLSDLAAELRCLPGCFLHRTSIVHFMDGEHCPQYLPALFKQTRLFRTRTIVTYHQPPELLDDLINPDVLACLDHVTVVSPTQLTYFHKYLPPGRVSTLMHGIDTEFFSPGSKVKNDRRFRCITVGYWLRDWRAVREVAEKLASKRNFEFHVVGKWDTGLNGLSNVFCHGNINDFELRALYQASDVLFLPVTQSTANNSLLEGIACGLPVVSTSLPSIEAYLTGGEGILVKDNDPDGLVEAILQLEGDPDSRQRMGRRARARAEELSWPKIAAKYEKLCIQLLSGGSPAHHWRT